VKLLRVVVCVLGTVAMVADLRPVAARDPDPAASLAERWSWLRCHDPARPRLGPAFPSIAERYRGDPEAQSRLSHWLETAGRGHWGDDYEMSQQSHLDASEAQALVRWVLGH